MLTTRGWWFLVSVLGLLAFAVLAGESTLTLLGFTLLLWFSWEWLAFAIRSGIILRRLQVQREVRDERGPVDTLWAGRTFHVQVELRLPEGPGLTYVRVADRVPFALAHTTGDTDVDGEVTSAQPLAFSYGVQCPAPGRARFEGIRLEMADLQGFFYHLTFVREVRNYRVLPPLTDAEGQTATVKRHNLLPAPGLHRFRRPGSSSELLDLRDYLPGDPPKTIAWKISARRDRLITKEFESEVPVRCTLFVDTSHSVRLGPPGQNALARLVEITAAVAQAAAATRDLTGLCLFDEARVTTYVRPARSARHLVYLLNILADGAGLAPATGEARVQVLLPLAYAFAQEVYPDLLRPALNRVPFWLPWLWPEPTYSRHGAALLRRRLPALFAPERRRRARWRKHLAALISVQYGLAPGGLALLLENDEQMSLWLQRFLADHQVPYPLPFYDRRGRYLFASPNKVEVLAGALLRAVGKGHDNELFVLLVDLLELPERLPVLLRAVKVALARHHQVMVVCPWPPGVPLPERRPSAARADLERATSARFHQAYHELRRTFARLGVPLACARSSDPVRLILDRLDRLRVLGRRR